MRKLNIVTRPVYFPLRLLEDVFQTVAESKPRTFAVMDLTSRFWQIKIDESSKPKIGYVIHRGNYQLNTCHLVFKAHQQVIKLCSRSYVWSYSSRLHASFYSSGHTNYRKKSISWRPVPVLHETATTEYAELEHDPRLVLRQSPRKHSSILLSFPLHRISPDQNRGLAVKRSLLTTKPSFLHETVNVTCMSHAATQIESPVQVFC